MRNAVIASSEKGGENNNRASETKLGDSWSETFSLDLPFICAFVHCDRDKVGEELRKGQTNK